ncbi:MAG: DUF362 domain-containing protein [Candidatus Latescibacterota bacterium]
MSFRKWTLSAGIVACFLTVLLGGSRFGGNKGSDPSGLVAPDAVSAATSPGQSTVGVVRSDYGKLRHPVPPDSNITSAQVEELVQWAVSLAGGLQTVIAPDARWIAIKVNIVEITKPGSGVCTDPRVVKAVVKLAHEAAPNARISIVEGAGEWISPDVPGVDTLAIDADDIQDGWEAAGFRALLKDPELSGINLDLVDLNVDEAIMTAVPEPWYSRDQYWMPRTVLDCDALIDVPVMKTHDGSGMTCAMKNFVGIAPGLKYGWGKSKGYPGVGPGIPHTPQVIDETIVDLTSLANPTFIVVDAIMAMERFKTDKWMGGKAIRRNTIIAGTDVVAVDAVCARLMGLNPDDIEFLTLAAHKGLGRIEEEQIRINGQMPEDIGTRFEKCPPGDVWGEMGRYGQSNRTWLFKGPFPVKTFSGELVDPSSVHPVPGKDGWSGPVYFSDDRINLGRLFEGAKNCVAYAYAEFTVTKDQPAELWVGSDEGLVVWMDGAEVYRFEGTRRHRLPNARPAVNLTAGTHRLLVKIGQTRGQFEFNLNICESEKDARYEGNRLRGLKFQVPAAEDESQTVSVPAAWDEKDSGMVHTVKNARWIMNPTTVVGAIEGALRAIGDSSRTTAYLMGVTGHAFRLTVSDSVGWDDAGAIDWQEALGLYRNVGYDFQMVSGTENEPGASDKMLAIWARATKDIDRGVPMLMRLWDYFLVRGYDARDDRYIVPTWDEEERVGYNEIGNEETGEFSVIFVGNKLKVDSKAAEKASFKFAVGEAFSPDKEGDRYSRGLQAYDRWINALVNNTVGNHWAHAYHTVILEHARRNAADYLDAVAAGYEAATRDPLKKAAEYYRKELESLALLTGAFGFDPPGSPRSIREPEKRSEAAEWLREARRWEEKAVREIESVVMQSQE